MFFWTSFVPVEKACQTSLQNLCNIIEPFISDEGVVCPLLDSTQLVLLPSTKICTYLSGSFARILLRSIPRRPGRRWVHISTFASEILRERKFSIKNKCFQDRNSQNLKLTKSLFVPTKFSCSLKIFLQTRTRRFAGQGRLSHSDFSCKQIIVPII